MRCPMAGLAGVVCGFCLVVGCTSDAADPVGQDLGYGPQLGDSASRWPAAPGVEIGDQSSAWWPVARARDLDPTGIDVVASSAGIGEIVVDGAGGIWVDMPWGLARLDPSSWSVSSWDARDDAAFASIRSLRASTTSGVWLIADDQVRLFDGVRFVREIQVPSAVLGEVPSGEEHVGDRGGVRDLIEVGSELWIASGAGVSRCDGHAWSVVGEKPVGDVQELQLTPWGEVWAGSTTSDGQWRWRRSAGTWWVPASWPDHLTADAIGRYPTGWIVALASSETSSAREFMQFDGSAWRKLLRLDDHDVADPVPVGAVAVSGKGTVWALTGEVLLRSTEEKGWHRMEAPDGVSLRGLAVSGDEVVVSTDTGLYRVSGDEFELVWSPQRGWAVVTNITDVVAVSGDQAWIVTTDWTSDPPGRRHLQRVQVGRTDPVLVTHLPESPELAAWLWGDVADAPAFARGTDPVVASDGAIWYVADESVIRIAGGSESTVAGRVGEDRLGGHVVNVNIVAMDQGGPGRADPRPREIGPDAFVELTVPGRTIAQTLYGDGDINCPDHWAHDRSLPVGQVQYTLTPQAIEITVTLTHAWPDTEYDVSVKTDQFCPEGAQASGYSERLTTDRDGAGSLTLTYQPRHSGPRLLAGYDGAVWMLPAARLPDPEDGEREEEVGREGICLLTPDGRCAAAELPAPAGKIMSLVGGTGGNLWATVCPAEPQEVAACYGGQHLMRWDAGWNPVPYPGADVTGLGAAPDGGFWGILAEKPGQLDDGILAHYREGRWTTFPELADADDSIDNHNDYALTPTGSVCRIAGEGPMLVCVDTSLRISRTPVGWAGKVAVADDGALWVWDNDWDNNVLTRMPITVP